jgi:hypothetical protein
LVVELKGAPGKAYSERTEKKIALVIRHGDTVVLGGRRYSAIASDLHCAVRWERLEDLEVLFFEAPRDSSATGRGDVGVDRLVFMVHFVFDHSRDEFVEAALPGDVTRRDRDPIPHRKESS